MIDWRIYYSDESTFDSSQGSPQDAPAYGVICIIYSNELVGRIIMHRWDWYYWVPDEGQWWGSDLFGVLDRLLHRLPTIALCQGRNVSNKTYSKIMGMADKDKDFPPKSGKIAGERPDGP